MKKWKNCKEWCCNAGPGVRVKFKDDPIRVKVTKVDNSNLWWVALKTECDKMHVKVLVWIMYYLIKWCFRNMKINTCIFLAGTDSRFIRNVKYKYIWLTI